MVVSIYDIIFGVVWNPEEKISYILILDAFLKILKGYFTFYVE